MNETAAVLDRLSLRALLAEAIDYAGLFPPASLDLASVVENYRAYRRSDDAWSLGRLIVPAARLDALAAQAGAGWRADAADHAGDAQPWRISALIGADVESDAARVAAFNERDAALAVVDSVESRATSPEEIRALAGHFGGLQHFIELPLDVELSPLLVAVRDSSARAKIRTGGAVASAIPSARDVARFLRGCADAGVAFKATAGLHHPLRGEYRLTYEASSAQGTMFGYLTLFLAAAQARDGAPVEVLEATLESRRSTAIEISDAEIRWDGQCASTQSLAATREVFALAFGSCSFREPLDDLGTLFAP
ncbi:MAG: hypothetical protein IPF98_12930 [Gemmatimonadetes bacterium]|nr:hypothetical protein [Gemmatimonadota bacterium]MCC6774792.1 hypothetical protein [Gemmatimonadaceae bacterium]